jgi:hypothetical protein
LPASRWPEAAAHIVAAVANRPIQAVLDEFVDFWQTLDADDICWRYSSPKDIIVCWSGDLCGRGGRILTGAEWLGWLDLFGIS